MANIIRNGQLIEGPSPSTPASAAAAGANPDSSKMAGSSAQKTNAIRQAVAAPVAPPVARTTATSEEAARSTTADRLSKVKGLGDRVDQMVEAKLAAPTAQTQLTVNTDGRGLTPEQDAAVKAYVAGINSGADAASMAQLEDSMNTSLKAGGVVDPKSFLADMGVQSGEQFQAGLGLSANLPLSQLQSPGKSLAETLSYDGDDGQLAQDLGVTADELGSMTLPQVQQRIRDISQQDFNQVAALRAEARTASPNRQAEIRQQLADMGATGQAAVDQSVAQLAQQIDQADQIEFNGQPMSIGDLLDNDAVSDTIIAASRDPKALAELQAQEPALAQWVTTNKARLEALTNSIDSSTQAGRDRQTQYATLTKDLSPELVSLLGGLSAEDSSYVSQAELEQASGKLASSGIAQAAKEDPTLATEIGLIAKDPANAGLLTQLQSMTKDELVASRTAAQSLEAGGPLASIIGPSTSKFITDPNVLDKIKEVGSILSAVPTQLQENPDFQALVKSGDINQEEADYIKEFGAAKFDDLKAWKESVKQVEGLKSPEDVAKMAGFGSSDAMKVFVGKLTDAARWGDTGAAAALRDITKITGTADGSIDLAKVKARLSGFAGTGQDPMDVMKGGGSALPSVINKSTSATKTVPERVAMDTKAFLTGNSKTLPKAAVDSIISDGKINSAELMDMYGRMKGDQALLNFVKSTAGSGMISSKDAKEFQAKVADIIKRNEEAAAAAKTKAEAAAEAKRKREKEAKDLREFSATQLGTSTGYTGNAPASPSTPTKATPQAVDPNQIFTGFN